MERKCYFLVTFFLLFIQQLFADVSLTIIIILVRAAAAEILPHLLECIQPKGKQQAFGQCAHNYIIIIIIIIIAAGPDAVSTMWIYISDKLLEAIPLEPDSEITGIMINSLCKVW